MAKYASTLLPQSNEPLEIQKAVLDLLDKINRNSTAAEASQAVPPGSILAFGGATAPEGYLLCDGASYLRVDYPALFAAIGETWGAADTTHFNVPNGQGVSLTGAGAQTINTRSKTGPALGEVREDTFQTHYHKAIQPLGTAGSPGFLRSATASNSYTVDQIVKEPIADTTAGLGDPRTGAYTHGPEIGVNYIIRAA